MNRCAMQYMRIKNYILGHKWQPVTIQDMLTFYGILMHYMLFPHTGRQMLDTWEDATRNKWTTYMSKSRYLKIIFHATCQ